MGLIVYHVILSIFCKVESKSVSKTKHGLIEICFPQCLVYHQTSGQEDKRFQVQLFTAKSQQVGEFI